MTLADRLKDVRVSLGYTQKEIASAVAVNTSTWQVYESGTSVPGGKVLEALAGLGFNVNWLLTGNGYMKSYAYESEPSVHPGGSTPQKLRKIRGDMPVQEFARRVGSSESEITAIENGKVEVSFHILSAICFEFGINPAWLLEDEGPMSKEEVWTRSVDFDPLKQYDVEDIDDQLMWLSLEEVNLSMRELGLDPKDLSFNKKHTIQNLIYALAEQVRDEPNSRYAKALCSLTYCEVCIERDRREKILGKDYCDAKVYLVVKAPYGLKCPMESNPREYITYIPVKVPDSAYYLRLIDDGSLILEGIDSEQ